MKDGSRSSPVETSIGYWIKKQGYTIQEVANEVGISRRTLSNYIAGVRMPPRNVLQRIATIIGCDPQCLLGNGQTLCDNEEGVFERKSLAKSRAAVLKTLDRQIIDCYEDRLALAWRYYYSGHVLSAIQEASTPLRWLESDLEAARGQAWGLLLGFQGRFLQVIATAWRDLLTFEQALPHINRALAIALHLDQAELLASALLRRARIYLLLNLPQLAIRDLERASVYAQRSRDPLKSYVEICLAEAYSLLPDRESQNGALRKLDQIGNLLAAIRGPLDGDGSYTRVDTVGWMIERSHVLARIGRLREAREALESMIDQVGGAWTRWQGNFSLAFAELLLTTKELDECCSYLRQALVIAQAIGSRNQIVRIKSIIEGLMTIDPHCQSVSGLMRDLGDLIRSIVGKDQ